jgi:hypothetical protein
MISALYKLLLQTLSSPARNVFNSRFLVTDVNSGDSSGFRAQVLLAQTPVQSPCEFPQSPELD